MGKVKEIMRRVITLLLATVIVMMSTSNLWYAAAYNIENDSVQVEGNDPNQIKNEELAEKVEDDKNIQNGTSAEDEGTKNDNNDEIQDIAHSSDEQYEEEKYEEASTQEEPKATNEDDTLTEEGKFRIALRWAGIAGSDYKWNATKSEKRIVKLTFSYENKVTPKSYNPNELIVTITGIGKLNRDGAIKAADIAADMYGTSETQRDWSYKYNASNDTYTFYNNHQIEEGASFNGSFELLWEFNSRDCINGYTQEVKATLSDGSESVESSKLTLKFTSERDTYKINKTAKAIASADGLSKYVPQGKTTSDYAWVQYTFTYNVNEINSRALQSRYFIDTLPEGCIIAKDTNVIKEQDGRVSYKIAESTVPENSVREYSIIVGYPEEYFGKNMENTVYLYGTYKDETTVEKLASSTAQVQLEEIKDRAVGVVANKNMSPDRVYTDQLLDDINFTANLYATSTASSDNQNEYKIAITDDLLRIYVQENSEGETTNGKYITLTDDEYKFTTVTIPGKNNFRNANGYTLSDGNYTAKISVLYKEDIKERKLTEYKDIYSGPWGSDSITVGIDKDAVAVRVEISGLKESIQSFNVTLKGIINISNKVETQEYNNPVHIINYDFTDFLDSEGKSLVKAIEQKDYTQSDIYERDQEIYGGGVLRASDTILIQEYVEPKPTPGYYYALADIEPFIVDKNVEYFTTKLHHSVKVTNRYADEIRKVNVYGVTGIDDLETLIESLQLTYSGLSFKNALSDDVNMNDYLKERATLTKDGKEILVEFDFSDNPITSKDFSLGYTVDARLNYEKYYGVNNPTYAITTYSHLPDSELEPQSVATFKDQRMAIDTDSESIILALASHQQLIKMVRTKYSRDFVQEGAVAPMDTEYTYRLKLRNGYNTLINTRFIDILERSDLTLVDGEEVKKSEWHGTFKNVDTTFLESQELVPTVYYATTENIDENTQWLKMKENEDGLWTTEEDKQKDVKAIKVEIEGEIAENSIVYVDVNMQSPNDKQLVDKKTYNRYTINCKAKDLYTGALSSYMENMPSNVVDVRLVEREYNLIITKTDATNNSRLSGVEFEIYNEKGEKITSHTTGILGNVEIASLKEGTYTIRETEALTGYDKADDHTLIIERDRFTLKYGEETKQEGEIDTEQGIPTISINIENQRKKGSIQVHKIDEYKKPGGEEVPLNGITFELLDTDENVKETKTTDENGELMFENLEWGKTYIIREKDRQQGYELAVENTYLSRLEINKTVNIENIRKTGILTLTKLDEKNEEIKLEGATYGVYARNLIYDKEGNLLYQQDDLVKEAKTDEDGKVTFDGLIWGEYYLKEIESVYGYELSEEKYEFEIDKESVEDVIEKTVKEERSKAKLQLIKVDENGSFLAGAEFGLFKGNGDEEGEQIINRNVQSWEEDVEFVPTETSSETYGWKQLEDKTWQSENYDMDNTTAKMESNEFTLEHDGKISFDWAVSSETDDYVYYTITNLETKETIGGVNTKMGGGSETKEYNLLAFYKTEENLKAGAYQISFIYEKNKSSKNGLDRAYVKNAKISYELVEEFPNTTDSNGQLIIEGLEWGEYYIQEIEPPQGYEKNDSKYKFSVNRETFKNGNGTIATVSNVETEEEISIIENIRKRGKVILTKYKYSAEGKETEDILQGAVYELYSADGKLITKQTESGEIITDYTTDEEGKITVDNLDWGSYYFQEKQAPSGYSVSDKKISFVINGKNVGFEQQLSAYDKPESGEIKINKTISSNSIYNAHGDATFIFKIVGKDENGEEKIVLYRTITFTEQDLQNKDENGNITKSITIPDAQAYRYEIIEEENYRYELSEIVLGNNASQDGNKGIIDLTRTTDKKGEITFTNEKNSNSLLTDNGLITNTAQSQYYLIGISAEPKEDCYEVGTELTAKDFTYTLYYSGGQEEVKELTDGITFGGKNTYSEDQPGSYIAQLEYTLNGRVYKAEIVTNWVMPSDYFTYVIINNKENTIAITGINEKYISPEILYIPSDYNGYKVYRVGRSGDNNSDWHYGWHPANQFTNIDNVVMVEIGKEIKEIGGSAFRGTNINKVDIGDNNGIKICVCAFLDCENLEEVNLTNTHITGISYEAFYRCKKLRTIGLPSSLATIGSNAFYDCNKLEGVVFPDDLTTIGDGAFYYCSSLECVDLSQTHVTSVGKEAFYGCGKVSTINVPSTLVSKVNNLPITSGSLVNINVDGANKSYSSENGILYDKEKTTLIRLPAKNETVNYVGEEILETIEVGACSGNKVLNTIDLSQTQITSIGSNTFSNCSSLTSIKMPEGVTSIGSSAFSGCSQLEIVDLSETQVTSIDKNAFSGCNNVTTIIIPSTLVSGVDNLPLSSSNLMNIEVHADNENYISEDGILYDKEKATLIRLPAKNETVNYVGQKTLERIEDNACSNNKIVESIDLSQSQINSIGNSAFNGCSSLTSIELPDTVTSIGNNTFYDCSALTSVDIPSAVTSIGGYAFYNCSLLKGMKLPDGITSIGVSTFYNCRNLESIDIPSTLTSIGSNAFYNCNALTDIDIPNTVTSIGSQAFYNCSKLLNIDIPNSITSIESSTFGSCSSLTSVNLPDGLISIGSNAFNNCRALTSIDIPSTVTSIGSQAFYNCNNLESIDLINTQITSIENYVFYGCSSLTNIDIPDAVTSIGNYAFYGCSSLTGIDIPDVVTSIGNYAFYYCKAFTSIDIPNSVTSIGSYAFYNCSNLENIDLSGTQITSIESYTFSSCSNLMSIDIPASVSKVGNYAFNGCSALTTINFHGTQDQFDSITIGTNNDPFNSADKKCLG